MTDRIIGCPHEEGIDYADGTVCPMCPYWQDRDRWTRMMTTSIARLSPQFSMQRAVIEYVENYYVPAANAS